MLKGKDFEKQFSDAFKKPDQYGSHLQRLYDTTSGYKTIQNPCDFILVTAESTFFLELKVTQEKSLAKTALTDNQYEKLLEIDQKPFTTGAVVVYFEKLNKVAVITLTDFDNYMWQSDRKSINYEQSADYFDEIYFEKKRVNLSFYSTDIVEVLNHMARQRK